MTDSGITCGLLHSDRGSLRDVGSNLGICMNSDSAMIYFERKFEEWEKTLPNQGPNSHLFRGLRANYEKTMFEGLTHLLEISSSVESYGLEAPQEWSVAEMGSSRLHLHFLQFLIRLTGARQVLEIGTFVGLSAIAFANSIPTGGRVTTIEKFPKFADIAKRNVTRNVLDHKIRVIVGDALEVLGDSSWSDEFDFIFIDGDKSNYLNYVELGLNRLSHNGLIIVDDIFFQGDVFNDPPNSEKGHGVKNCLQWVCGQQSLHASVLPVGNGILLIRKSEVFGDSH